MSTPSSQTSSPGKDHWASSLFRRHLPVKREPSDSPTAPGRHRAPAEGRKPRPADPASAPAPANEVPIWDVESAVDEFLATEEPVFRPRPAAMQRAAHVSSPTRTAAPAHVVPATGPGSAVQPAAVTEPAGPAKPGTARERAAATESTAGERPPLAGVSGALGVSGADAKQAALKGSAPAAESASDAEPVDGVGSATELVLARHEPRDELEGSSNDGQLARRYQGRRLAAVTAAADPAAGGEWRRSPLLPPGRLRSPSVLIGVAATLLVVLIAAGVAIWLGPSDTSGKTRPTALRASASSPPSSEARQANPDPGTASANAVPGAAPASAVSSQPAQGNDSAAESRQGGQSGAEAGADQAPRAAAPAKPQAASGLAGRWTLASGNLGADSTGKHPANATNVAHCSGHGGCGVFNGSNSQMTTSGPVLNTGPHASFTVSAWVYLTGKSHFETAVSQDASSGSGFFLQYSYDDDRWSFSRLYANKDGVGAARARSSSAPALKTWTHLVGVYDHTTHDLLLFVNGALEGTAADATPYASSGPLVIGRARANSGNGDYFAGDISDVRVFGRALTTSQVRVLG